MPAALDQVFKAYDVRGVYPDQLDEELAERVGRAFVALTGAATLAIGQDMRPSSKPMADALAAGAMAQGADVLRVGLCSTDMLYYVSGALDVAGVMLTASHNPARYNGLKLCRAGAVPVGEESGLADIKRMIAAGEPAAPSARRGRERQADDLLERYAAHVRSFADLGALRPLKVVADAGNGMAGHVVPAVFAGLPFELVSMYFELDGSFPNHPADPLNPDNLRELQARVVAEGADVGLAFDGDADRVFLVDELGAAVPSSLVGALVARLLCEREPGATVLYNLICSRVVPETIREAGGVPVRTRVGHSFIKGVMAETGAVFGCEHSGPLLLPRQLPGRLGPDRRPGHPGRPLEGGQAAVGGARPLPPLRRLGGGQPARRRRPRPGHRGRGRALPGGGGRLHRRADRRGRRLVVQSATEQHRTAAPAQRRGRHRGRDGQGAGRGAGGGRRRAGLNGPRRGSDDGP